MFLDFKVATGELDNEGRNVSGNEVVAVWAKSSDSTATRDEALALVNELFDTVEAKAAK